MKLNAVKAAGIAILFATLPAHAQTNSNRNINDATTKYDPALIEPAYRGAESANMKGDIIGNVGTPQRDSDGANKAYVDGVLGIGHQAVADENIRLQEDIRILHEVVLRLCTDMKTVKQKNGLSLNIGGLIGIKIGGGTTTTGSSDACGVTGLNIDKSENQKYADTGYLDGFHDGKMRLKKDYDGFERMGREWDADAKARFKNPNYQAMITSTVYRGAYDKGYSDGLKSK